MEEKQQEKNKNQIDVLSSHIIACQQESASYNNAFISSAVICTILTVIAGFLSESSSSEERTFLLYIIPMVYLLILYNLLKYTGFQISLGAYRHFMEEKLNDLLEEKTLLWETNISHDVFFTYVDGAGQIAFFLPPLILLGYLIISIQVKSTFWVFFVVVYIVEILLCLIQGINLIRKKRDGSAAFSELMKDKKAESLN